MHHSLMLLCEQHLQDTNNTQHNPQFCKDYCDTDFISNIIQSLKCKLGRVHTERSTVTSGTVIVKVHERSFV